LYKIPSGTLFLGKNLLILPECPSTNTLALELAQSGKAPEGTVVITHHQTSGRGQRGNTWESGSGLNLTLSVVLHPAFLQAAQQFTLNKVVALSVHEVVSSYSLQAVRVKWPNDIMIGDKKVCGILIENQLTGSSINRSVAGIGLNVNQKTFESPSATGLALHSEKALELDRLFEQLMQSLEWRYLQLKNGHQQKLDDDYLSTMYRLNEPHQFIIDETETTGIIRNVDAAGRLVVESRGQLRSHDLKEIKYVY
jgi:BirA family transcriptional regulator, biotin operon repressor / biotin---[acetyl-CoA-carboxylase] ligase